MDEIKTAEAGVRVETEEDEEEEEEEDEVVDSRLHFARDFLTLNINTDIV